MISPDSNIRLFGIGKCVKGMQYVLDPVQNSLATIGRTDECHLQVYIPEDQTTGDVGFVSRRHVQVSWFEDKECWMLEDLNSTNGTRLIDSHTNAARRIDPQEPQPMRINSIVELGGSDHFNFLVVGGKPSHVSHEAEDRTLKMMQRDEACLELLEDGGVVASMPLSAGFRAEILGTSGESRFDPDSHSLHWRGLPHNLLLARLAANGEGVLEVRRQQEFPYLRNGEPVHASGALSDGDLLSFADSFGVHLLVHLPHLRRPAPLSSLAQGDEQFRVGREEGADRRYGHPSVSRSHAEFRKVNDVWWVTDLDSSNRTMVNGKPVSGLLALQSGDRLRIGVFEWIVDDGTGPFEADIHCQGLRLEGMEKASRQPCMLVHPIDIRIGKRELTAVIGPSGSGKSCFMKMLAGELQPSGGELYINGKRQTHSQPSLWQRFFGSFSISDLSYVQQIDAVFANTTVWEMLENRGLQQRLKPAEIRERANRALQFCRIEHLRNQVLTVNEKSKVSGGELKRVCIAAALISGANTILLDEPTSPLDPGIKQELFLLFRGLAKEQSITTLVTLHDTQYLPLFDKVLVMALGRMVYFGPPAGLARHFGVNEAQDLFHKLPRAKYEPAAQEAALELEQSFQRHPYFAKYCRMES